MQRPERSPWWGAQRATLYAERFRLSSLALAWTGFFFGGVKYAGAGTKSGR